MIPRSLSGSRYGSIRWRNGALECDIDGARHHFGIVRSPGRITVFEGSESFIFDMPDPLESAGEGHAGGSDIRAPMPGFVKQVSDSAGDAVARGDVLIVLEAMKMEHSLGAPRDGIIAEVMIEDGAQVEDGMILLRLEPEDE